MSDDKPIWNDQDDDEVDYGEIVSHDASFFLPGVLSDEPIITH
jgi:hypothetical protein